jgi:hypothetical protein
VSTQTRIVSASKIGKMAWCPHGGSLQENGVQPNSYGKMKAKSGTASHDNLTTAVCEHQEQDRRCFVASYALGPDHLVTQQLRDWRDSQLKPRRAGRFVIAVYYALSPLAIRIVSPIPFARSGIRSFVLLFARMVLIRKESK